MDTLRSCSVATAFPNLLRALTLRVLPLLPLLLHDGALAGEQPADAGSSKGSVGEPALRKLDDVLASTNSFRITDVTLFDGEKVIEQATVVVRGGWISKVCEGGDPQCAAPELSTVEGVGKFLMPSMIDAEGHFSRPTEGLDELLEHDRPVCGTGPENQGKTLRVSTFELMSAFAEKGLFTEVDAHGLRLENGIRPHRLGERSDSPKRQLREAHPVRRHDRPRHGRISLARQLRAAIAQPVESREGRRGRRSEAGIPHLRGLLRFGYVGGPRRAPVRLLRHGSGLQREARRTVGSIAGTSLGRTEDRRGGGPHQGFLREMEGGARAEHFGGHPESAGASRARARPEGLRAQRKRRSIKPGYRADLLLLRESPVTDILNTLKIERVYKAGYLANRQMVRPECATGDCETRRILHSFQGRQCSPGTAESRSP